MAVKAWADSARENHRNSEDQRIIGAFQSLLEGNLDAQAAAHSIAATCEPLIQKNPNDLRIGAVWSILCDAVKALGSSTEVNERLAEFLASMSELPVVTGPHGDAIKHEWGGTYWTDLPTFALTFREYGIDIDADENMEEREWLAQATPYLNATAFAATCLSRNSSMLGMSFHAQACLVEAVEGPYDSPESGIRALMYIPPAATWISLAGDRIYQLCRNNYERNDDSSRDSKLWWKGSGFSLARWTFWKKRFGEIRETRDFETRVREYAGMAVTEMERIEKAYNQG